MVSKLLRVIFCALTIFLFSFFVVPTQVDAQSNTDGSAELEIDNTDVEFDCSGCSVFVEDTQVSGTIWGESLGWVNLQPADGGVESNREGVLSGNGWGATSGWLDFTGVFIDPNTGDFSGEAISQNRGVVNFDNGNVNTDWRPEGCTDPGADNYDSTSVVDDGSCSYTPGCTDPVATNYSSEASLDDGSCEYSNPTTLGCTDPDAVNYDVTAMTDDGSCSYEIEGCTDSAFDNYDPEATIDDGSCSNDIEGCTDPEAFNYNQNATIDDGSCTDEEPILGCTNSQATNYNEEANIDDSSCLYGEDFYGCMDPEADNYDPEASIQVGNACDYGGDGCVDPNADNYDPEATANDGSCEYSNIEGCTQFNALNFNPYADIDDGSCLYGIGSEGCTDPNAVNYNEEAVTNNNSCVYISDPVDDPENPDNPNNPDSQDPTNNPNDSTSFEDVIGGVVENLPNANEVSLVINRYVTQETPLMRLLTLALLLSSILQILPIREGNLLLSLFGFYKTKRYWGTVYDSQTKQPLDPAYVTLFDDAGQAVDTSITDLDGRYNFIIGPGTYYLSAQKTDYLFPSKKLEGKSYDELYSHLYFGGPVEVKSQDHVLSLNIPMDPLKFNWNEFAKRKTKVTHFYRPWHRILAVISKTFFISGFGLAVWVFIASPTILSFVILSFYILTTVLRLVGFRHFPRGHVKDSQGFALAYGIIRVYSAELNREVKHTIITEGGHYLILVPNGKYYLLVEQKKPDGEYQEVYRTQPFKVRRGFIAKKITLHNVTLSGVEAPPQINTGKKKNRNKK